MEGKQSFLLCAVTTVLLTCVPETVMADFVTKNMSDPLSSFFIRQEAALRKLDDLIAMVSKADQLETRLDQMTNLLKGQEDKNSALESKLEAMETKHEALLGKVEGKIDAKLFEIQSNVEETISKIESKIEAKLEEMEHNLQVKLTENNIRLDSVVGNINKLNVTIHMIGASVSQVEARLDDVSSYSQGECQEAVALMVNDSNTTKQIVEDSILNLTMATGMALEDMKSYVQNVVEGAVNSSQPQCDTQVVLDCQRSLSRLEELVAPSANVTKHLIAAVFNRIRVSNLAMDKRLGALLHTSSIRQRVLQDTLLAAITSVDTLVRTQMLDLYRKIESSMGGLEDLVATSANRHVKEIATQFLDTANYSFIELSSSTAAQIDLLLQTQANTTHAIDVGLSQLQELHNITMTQLAGGAFCMMSGAEVPPNGTITYSDRPFRLLDDTVSSMQGALVDHLTRLSDQLSALRIYYSTSLHMHAQQVSSEVASMTSRVERTVQEMLSKSSRTLEKLRQTSLGYLDAAVTTVTSAAVASAEATADQLSAALHTVAEQLERKLTQVERVVRVATAGCPPQYSMVDGSCLLPLPGADASWQGCRKLCRDAGGDLATIPYDSTLRHLYLFHTTNSTLPSPYWVGGRRVEETWRWVTGAPVVVTVGAASFLEEEDGHEAELCLMWKGNGVELVAAPCHTPRGALCQYPHSSRQSYLAKDSDNTALESNMNPINSSNRVEIPAE
nr:uncharacterized protein LOC123762711 [Procambarus clarkii]